MIKNSKPNISPDYPVRINWANPTTQGLKGLWFFNESSKYIRNIVDNKITALTSGAPIQTIGKYGRELDHNAANGYPVFTNYDLPNEFSVFTLCKYNSNTIDHAVFDYATQAPILWADTLSSQLRPALFSGGTVSYGSSNSLSIATGYNTWGAVMRSNNTDNRFFVNGDLQGIGNPGTWTAGNNTFRLLANNAGSKNSDSNTVWVVMFERALSYDEAIYLTKNPFSIYSLIQPLNVNLPFYSPTVGGGVTVTPSGVSSTSAVGALTVTGSASFALTGVEGVGQIGALSILAHANVTLTGAQSNAAVGALTVTGHSIQVLTGISSSSGVGSLSISAAANVALQGVEGTGAIGLLNVVSAGGVTTVITGVESTSATGILSPIGHANVALTGTQSAGQVGTLSAVISQNVTLIGVQSLGEVGAVTFVGGALLTISGVETTGQAGNFIVNTGSTITITGLQSTGQIGSVTVSLPGISTFAFVDAAFSMKTMVDSDLTITPMINTTFTVN